MFGIGSFHIWAEFPGHYKPGEIIQDRSQEIPSQKDNLQVSEVNLPLLIDPGGLVLLLIGCLVHKEGR